MSLCVNGEMKDLAEHLARIHRGRKQDGTIFVGSQVNERLLTQTAALVPSLFTSECPIFMPKYTYDIKLNLRLDSNVLFYEKVDQTKYKLVDIFAIKGGPLITLDLANWDIENGIRFKMSMNRWKRRTDLKGAMFVNGLAFNGIWAEVIKDDKDNIVGSKGFMQDKLFCVTDGLNLTIQTVEYDYRKGRKRLENGTWAGPFGMLQRKELDVDSVGISLNTERLEIIDFPIQTHTIPMTFIARRPEGTAPNMWVYVRVFGVPQWSIFLASLTLLAIGLSLTDVISKAESIESLGMQGEKNDKYFFNSFLSMISLVYLYTIQMGEHISTRVATGILTITTSLLTLMIFVYYTGEITAEMTSGPPQGLFL